MPKKKRMYAEAKTWNPFKGCEFDCTYCKPSFQLQAKRQKHICSDCYDYIPHEHEDRWKSIPSSETVFVCANADISFCDAGFTRRIIQRVIEHSKRCPHKTFYFQSKKPEYFKPFLSEFPESVILLTTLETNRNAGYKKISKAPLPSTRYKQFLNLKYPRKVITVEPVMDFDEDVFLDWIKSIEPEYVWIGYNSRPKTVDYPEPSKAKVKRLIAAIKKAGIKVKLKEMRDKK